MGNDAPKLVLIGKRGWECEQVLDLLLHVTKQMGRAVIVVTHDTGLAARLDRTLILKEGRLETRQ